MSAHEHLSEPELIEIALADADTSRTAVAGCATCSARSERIRVWLEGLRGAAAASEAGPAGDSRLVERVLASTTREDLGVRGDLRLAWRYCRTALRNSAALRAAAVLLVVQLAALPVLAVIALRTPVERPQFIGTFELPRDPVYTETDAEPEREISADEPSEPRLRESTTRADEPGVIAFRRDEARALRESAIPQLGDVEPRDEIAKLLWARARQIETGRLTEELASSLDRPAPEDTGRIELALRLDVLLDRWSLTGVRPEAARGVSLALVDAQASEREVRSALVERALRRAELHGLLAPAAASELAAAESANPLGRAWVDALGALDAGPAGGEREAVLRAWRDALR
jgi:hypothetical protein